MDRGVGKMKVRESGLDHVPDIDVRLQLSFGATETVGWPISPAFDQRKTRSAADFTKQPDLSLLQAAAKRGTANEANELSSCDQRSVRP